MGISVIIMAGGIGKRMNSKKVKVLHNILGHPLIYYVFETARMEKGEEKSNICFRMRSMPFRESLVVQAMQ